MTKKHNRCRFNFGPGGAATFRGNETAEQRHARRWQVAIQFIPQAADVCRSHGLQLRVRNTYEHWIIDGREVLVEWWPRTARLVLWKRYNEAVHVHDWPDVWRIVMAAVELTTAEEST